MTDGEINVDMSGVLNVNGNDDVVIVDDIIDNEKEIIEEKEDLMCMICGDLLCERYTETLTCNHTYHYDCIMKTYQMNKKGTSKHHKNRCPYCRTSCGYLPIVNGILKPIKCIHYDPRYAPPVYVPIRCSHILTRGKNKGQTCNCKCQIGFYTCKRHTP